MTRYFLRPRSIGIPRDVPRARYAPMQAEDIWYTDPLLPHIDAPEHDASFTGLLDSKGKEIWREPRPVGFGRDGEW